MVLGPDWKDDAGWGAEPYWSTIRLAGEARPFAEHAAPTAPDHLVVGACGCTTTPGGTGTSALALSCAALLLTRRRRRKKERKRP